MNPFEKIKEELQKIIDISYYKTVDGTPYAGIKNVAYHKVLELVEQVEKEYNNGWIPCKEKLPKIYEDTKTSEVVLVLGYYKDTNSYWQAMAYYVQELKQWVFAECKNTDKPIDWIDIIAWQPLPVPYTIKEKERMK